MRASGDRGRPVAVRAVEHTPSELPGRWLISSLVTALRQPLRVSRSASYLLFASSLQGLTSNEQEEVGPGVGLSAASADICTGSARRLNYLAVQKR